MKVIKFLMAMTLATVPVMSGFMKPAAAQRSTRTNTQTVTGNSNVQVNPDDLLGNGFSVPNSPPVVAQFILFNTDRKGNLIHDAEQYDDTVGVFFGAIEDYNTGSGSLLEDKNGQFARGFLNLAQFDVPFTPEENLFVVGNLRAKLISTHDGSEAIEYSIFGPGKKDPILQTNQKIVPCDCTFDKKRAVNDLTYILKNNLLEGAIATFQNPRIPGYIIGEPLVRTSITVRDRTTVPEPSATLGALAILSTGLLLKRKMKQNRTA